MATCYIGIGSNLGESRDICEKAIALLGETKGVEIEEVSSLYKTEPVGFETQPSFINGAARVQTTLDADELFRQMRRIEEELGRVTKFKWGPRYIDLDLLLFDELILEEKELTIPHPLMHQRRFVLTPLSEIANEVRHPVLGKTIAELLLALDDEKKVEQIK